ncbi:MAG: hypothetical protein ABI895_23210 [Deltaproteobacteria bacterium]
MTSDPINPYRPPQAEPPHFDGPAGAQGSIEQALAGNYDFDIGEVMSEAWELTKGFKATFWGGALIVYGVVIAVMLVSGLLSKALFGDEPHLLMRMGTNALATLLTSPLTLGLIMLAVKRAAGVEVTFEVVFGCMNKAVPAIVVSFLTLILTYLGLALLLIPGIYLSLAYGMAKPLLADRNLPPWQAMEVSRKALTHKWFQILGLSLGVGFLVLLSALFFGIGLIWTAPWSMLVLGVLYRRIFGTTEPTPVA